MLSGILNRTSEADAAWGGGGQGCSGGALGRESALYCGVAAGKTTGYSGMPRGTAGCTAAGMTG